MLAREELDAEHSGDAQQERRGRPTPDRLDQYVGAVRHGPNVSPMTMYMYGFWEGVRQYNK